MVHEQHAGGPERIGYVDYDVAALPQGRNQVGQRPLPPIDFAALQRCCSRGRVGDHHPFHSLDEYPLCAREPGGRFLPWAVVREPLEYGPGTGQPFVLDEAHRPAADMFADLLEGIGRGDPGGHDEAAWGGHLSQRQQHLRKRPPQRPAEGPVIDDGELALHGLDNLAHGLTCSPAPDTGHGIRCQHGLAVVEFQGGPQPERPEEAIRRHILGFNHLALRLQVGIDAVKRVPHEQRGVARDVGGAPDRIEIGQIRMRHETQCACRGALGQSRASEPARRRGRDCRGRRF